MGGYIGATAVGLTTTAADVQGDITSTDTTPELILKNTSEEDTEGGREGKITFKGEQSGGEESTLAQIESAHDGTSDDEKGDLIFKTNDGSDGASPTERVRIDSNGSILTATLGTDNVHLGEGAGASIASGGNNNVTIGKDAGTAITTGDDNVAVGYQALDANTTGGNSVAVGSNALGAQTTGDRNIGIGSSAGAAITTGQGSIAIGHQALASATTGDDNVAIGCDSPTVNAALEVNTTGTQNVAVGGGAMSANTTASNNTAVGYQAGLANTTGDANTLIGRKAGFTQTTGRLNTFIGDEAGGLVTTGISNTFVGNDSGYSITTGSKSTILGCYTGNSGGLDLRTSNNSVVLSDGDGNVVFRSEGTNHRVSIGDSHLFGDTGFGNTKFTVNNDSGNDYTCALINNNPSANQYGFFIDYQGGAPNSGNNNAFITARDTSATRFLVMSNGAVQSAVNSYGSTSDETIKENIVASGSQWNDIKAIQVKKFSYIRDELDAPNMIGVIAQDLEAAGMTGLVEEIPVERDSDETVKTVKYSVLYMKAVKALQEAMTRIETLETENTTQATQIADLITRVEALEGA